jgi:hypothetical protein
MLDYRKRHPEVPVVEDLDRKVLAAVGDGEFLEMGTWHTCETTHCRGGWAIALCGEQGHALEQFYNWELAAILIYDASDPDFKINPARFYDSNVNALADMKRLAELEAQKS